jgi:hypothetical protein
MNTADVNNTSCSTVSSVVNKSDDKLKGDQIREFLTTLKSDTERETVTLSVTHSVCRDISCESDCIDNRE